MSVGEIIRALSETNHWQALGRKMTVIAARYYAGVDSYETLNAYAQPVNYGRGLLPPVLTSEQVDEIIRLR